MSFQPPGLATFAMQAGGAAADMVSGRSTFAAATAWPANNRAIYFPVVVHEPCTAYQMAIEVTTQAGNLDIGIYDELGNRLVHSGSTAVAAAGVQVVNITDTALTPGVYFLAICIDTTGAAIRCSASKPALDLQTFGVQQQAVGAVTLPDPATFANPASGVAPAIWVSTLSSVI